MQAVDGVTTSSASQPSMMAIMLGQLDLQPGHRVLEIGAGTGYNAALMARIVGPGGRVVAVDIDADLVDGAARHLAAAGVDGVELVCADGARGYPPAAPYDRIVLTVGSGDVRPEWVAAARARRPPAAAVGDPGRAALGRARPRRRPRSAQCLGEPLRLRPAARGRGGGGRRRDGGAAWHCSPPTIAASPRRPSMPPCPSPAAADPRRCCSPPVTCGTASGCGSPSPNPGRAAWSRPAPIPTTRPVPGGPPSSSAWIRGTRPSGSSPGSRTVPAWPLSSSSPVPIPAPGDRGGCRCRRSDRAGTPRRTGCRRRATRGRPPAGPPRPRCTSPSSLGAARARHRRTGRRRRPSSTRSTAACSSRCAPP